MATDDTFRVSTRGTLRGQSVQFGVHIRMTSGTGTPEDLAATWVATIMPAVDAATSAEVNYNEIVVSDVRRAEDGGVSTVVLSLTQPHPGLVVGECLPNQNAIVVGLRTGRKGKRFSGRLYLPPPVEANTSNGLVTGTQLTAVQALAQLLITTFGAGGTEPQYQLVVYSPPTPPYVPKPAPPVHTDTLKTPVTSHDVDQVVRSQRRRAIGVGA